MKPAILTLMILVSATISLCGQTNNHLFDSREENKDTSFSGIHYRNQHIYHFNEIPKMSEINIYRHERSSPDLNINRFYQYGRRLPAFHGYASLKERSVISLPLDNMPCLIPDKKGKIINTEPDHSVIFF
jgi:hypothetical protein